MNGQSTRSNLRAPLPTRLGTSVCLRVGKTARKLSEPFSTEQAICPPYWKLPPDQPGGADEVDETDREDEDACPLAVAVVGHALDHEWRERCARDRKQDGRRNRPKWNIA